MTDLDEVVREIEADVRAKRASGELPVELERDLDRLFARYVPAAGSNDDFAGLLATAHEAAFIDPDPPLGSRLPVARYLKTGEHRLLGWYFRYLAQQVTSFAAVAVQAVEVLGNRVDRLAEVVRLDADPAAEAGRLPAPTVGPELVAAAASHLAAGEGRVLVVEAGDGELLRALVDAGRDAYGIDPSPERAGRLAAAGHDVRDDGALLHLGAVANGALGGIALAGCIDRSATDEKLRLLDLAVGALAPSGTLVVLGRHPDGWGRDNPVEADLSPARPFRPETWVHLLADRGYVASTLTFGDGYAVLARRGQ